MLLIEHIKAFNDNYIWMIRNTSSNCCVVVDPGDADPVIDYLNDTNLTLEGILITHKHGDHVGGVERLQQLFNAPSYGPDKEAGKWIDHAVSAQDRVNFPHTDITLEVLEVPGHTLGHIAYYADRRLFCGDTLFVAGCGRVFEGTMSQMYESLQSLAQLDEETLIYCAHEYTLANLKFALAVEPENIDLQDFLVKAKALREQEIPTVPSSIGQEKRINPFLRCSEPKVAQAAMQHAMIETNKPVEVFSTIRQWKDNF